MRLPNDKDLIFEDFFDHYIKKYTPLYYLFFPGRGYIVWRFATGENVELLHIRAFKTGNGLGVRLIKAMLRELRKNPPYYSVFGMTLASNSPAQKMYERAGFKTLNCPFPYKHDNSVVFFGDFQELCEKLLRDDDEDQDLMGNVVKSSNLI